MSALEERDFEMLRQISSQEFSRGTWNRMNPEMFSILPLHDLPHGELKLESSRVRGQQTELEFQAASGQLLTIILSDENGTLRVDDLQFPTVSESVISLKTQIELTVPLLELASAWRQSDLTAVRSVCSREFNRLVWSNMETLPADFSEMPGLLTAPVSKVQVGGKEATVVLRASGKAKATIRLLSEDGFWVVDEVALNRADGSSVQMRSALRKDIAHQILQHPAGSIQKAGFYSTETVVPDGNGVVRAHAQYESVVRGNLTLPSSRRPMPLSSAVTEEVIAPVAPIVGMPAIPQSPASAPKVIGPSAAVSPLMSPPQLAPETEEHDGVVYFRAGPASKDQSSVPEESPSADNSSIAPKKKSDAIPKRITDPSSHPIEIPQ